jgi:hypothetical protein
MSRDTHPGVQCPHCQSHLALVPATGDPVSGNSAAAPIPVLPIVAKEEWQPPPVAEVLAVYAGRAKDTVTAARGAAKVRESLNRAKAAAAQRRAAQKTARRTPRSA